MSTACEDLPVQVPQDDVARRGGCVEGGEGVAAHLADCRERGPLASIQFERRANTVYVGFTRAGRRRPGCVL
jgi:hypothetical protein